MKKKEVFDVIVVGSGATGAWAARELTKFGAKVLVLEAGPSIQPFQIESDPSSWGKKEHELLKRQPIQRNWSSIYHPSLFVDDRNHPYSTPLNKPFAWIRSRVLGGRTLTWGGVTLRMSDFDFKAAARDGFGENWPLTYRDLAPYYDRVERWLKISGSYENLPQLPDSRFYVASRLNVGEMVLKEKIESLWGNRKVIPLRGVLTDYWDDIASQKWGRRTSVGSSLMEAKKTGRLTVESNAIVSHIIEDRRTGFAKGVACVDSVTHRHFERMARIVVLCASTIESTRILLSSRTPNHPEGIGAASGVLGHHLFDHFFINLAGHCPTNKKKKTAVKTRGQGGFYIPRFRNLERREKKFIRGYGIQGKIQDNQDELDNVFTLVGFGEVLSRHENRIVLDKTKRDFVGLPVPRIEFSYGDNEYAMARDGVEFFTEISNLMNFKPITKNVAMHAPGLSNHECGTARMGTDPKTSVLNPFNQVWDMKNLFVTDGASFVSGGCQNPTLTMMALTSRACAYICQQIKKREL